MNFAKIDNFLAPQDCEFLCEMMDADDCEVSSFNVHPYIAVGDYVNGSIDKLTVQRDPAYKILGRPMLETVIRSIMIAFAKTAHNSFPSLVFDRSHEVSCHLMGLRLTPEGSGESGWHQDNSGRLIGILVLTDEDQYSGGELCLRNYHSNDIVFGPAKLNQGDLLLVDDWKLEHARTSCFANENTRCVRRTILNLKVEQLVFGGKTRESFGQGLV
mgnify:CR=1 FL=1